MIRDVLISDALLKQHFVCNLGKCKGACCWQGDYGAPLGEAEVATLEAILPDIKSYLTHEGLAKIESDGFHKYFPEKDFEGTNLLDNGACVFMTTDETGTAKCGIESAWRDGVIDFQKPISCHLYPVRISKIEHVDFDAANYDQWDICSPACSLGDELKMPLYRFVKDALVRKYGEDFYNELEAVASDLDTQEA